jgi:hypothetical protein
MKKTRQELNQLIAEELQQMLENGELTEQQIQEIVPQFMKNWWANLKKPKPNASKGVGQQFASSKIKKWSDKPTSADVEQPVSSDQVIATATDGGRVSATSSTQPSATGVQTSTAKPGERTVSSTDGPINVRFTPSEPQGSVIKSPELDAASSTGLPAKSTTVSTKDVYTKGQIEHILDTMAMYEKQLEQAKKEQNWEKATELRAIISDLKTKADEIEPELEENKKINESKYFNRWQKLAGIIKG